MRTLGAPALAALAQTSVPIVQLIHMNFGGGPVALNTSTWDLLWGGVTYKGAYGLGTIAPIEDAPGEIRGLQFTLSGVAASSIALALDSADEWQGVAITIRTAILDSSYTIVDAPIEWTGLGDTMSLQEDGETATITATAESTGVDLLRGAAVTYTDADQRNLYAGDLFFQYVNSQDGQPIVWPTKEWFYK